MSGTPGTSGSGGSGQTTQTGSDDLVARVVALVELKRRFNEKELTPMGERIANARFWEKMRGILFVNGASVGAAQLDGLATAVIHDNPDDAFDSVITLIPWPVL
ncbi:hypothetical protein JG687_00019040 [Phytophthora cactorum]|uniref:Uncharacterized protein n=1 Tax=Phytophthora cactorum TaxID=29920 RepID=A0A329RKD1_9STRA|nr:hypothetical protein Pcac1_g17756 [Phytophthora cactorum]KAG2809962.1 hypothetical protein PC112_g16265 [Phytophthora cactorum]KAG2810296.1 hypothetical protein PC111_g15712 [Phytophthora cactorum]KAG2860607.1 hypothetical protein PC113_g7896 [Phytophthora cactorum]KAG2915458.1 hypothetical protein PC114_g7845 [Phytophthora cactorum]